MVAYILRLRRIGNSNPATQSDIKSTHSTSLKSLAHSPSPSYGNSVGANRDARDEKVDRGDEDKETLEYVGDKKGEESEGYGGEDEDGGGEQEDEENDQGEGGTSAGKGKGKRKANRPPASSGGQSSSTRRTGKDDQDEGSSDPPEKRRKQRNGGQIPTPNPTGLQGPLYACPYHKNNPQGHLGCARWKNHDIHRVK